MEHGMVKTKRLNLGFAALQILSVVGLITFTNTELLPRILLLLKQGRIGTLATTGAVWVFALFCITVVLLEKRRSVRLFWALILAVSGTLAWGFQRAAHLELSVFDILGFWEARHEAGNAAALYGEAIKLALALSVVSFAVYALPYISRTWGPSRFAAFRAVVPALPIAVIAGIVFLKGGNGHFAMPKQFSQVSLAALASGKLALHPTVSRSPVALNASAGKAASRILYLVDESLRPDFLDLALGNAVTPHFANFATQLVNYGPAASGAICSNYSNAILRFLPARSDIGGAISTLPTVWQYAKAAGYRTVYIDGQGHAIENETKLQNFMTPAERKYIDAFYPLPDITSKDADMEVLSIIEKEFAKPGPVFIYANKQGMHFPYDQNYDLVTAVHHPVQSEVSGIDTDSMLNSYRNAVSWNVDRFFGEFSSRISMKDLAMVYTSDHGQYFAPGEATHCKSSDSHPQMALVPLFAYVDSADGVAALKAGAEKSKGLATHFQIAPTLLNWMGYSKSDLALHYKESLTEGTYFDPAYTLGDIFGLFSSDVEWVKPDLSKDYRELNNDKVAGEPLAKLN
jgi:Sulfatase